MCKFVAIQTYAATVHLVKVRGHNACFTNLVYHTGHQFWQLIMTRLNGHF